MSSAILLDQLRNEPIEGNPYFAFFKDSVGRGGDYHEGVGNIFTSLPDYQRGYGILPRGSFPFGRVQVGEGIGSLFLNLFRKAAPMITSVAKHLFRGAAEIGRDTLSDALAGENIKSSLKKHVKTKISDTLPEPVAKELNKRIGSGKRRVSKSRSSTKKRRKKSDKKYPVLGLIN
jgi:hypothetical protein